MKGQAKSVRLLLTGLKMSPIQAEPMIRKDVPWKAVMMRKTK